MTTANDRSMRITHRRRRQIWRTRADEESDGDDERRWLTVHGDDGSSVDVAVLRQDTDAEVVWLYAEQGANLTPAQARAASLALLEAASWAEDHRTG